MIDTNCAGNSAVPNKTLLFAVADLFNSQLLTVNFASDRGIPACVRVESFRSLLFINNYYAYVIIISGDGAVG